MNLLAFILACYGMTMILVYGSIFNNIRPKNGFFGKLFKCTMCMGFWVGIFINICMYILNKDVFDSIIFGSFLSGCISSGTSYFLSRIVTDEGLKIDTKS
jgi:hypothetical protein